MKKCLPVVVFFGLTLSAFAGPGNCCPERRPCPPPPHHYGHCDHGGSSGVRLAADIVGLVGVSVGTVAALNALTTPSQPVVVAQPQPVVVAQPVAQPQPVVVAQPVAQPQPVVVAQPAVQPSPRTITILPDGTRIEKY